MKKMFAGCLAGILVLIFPMVSAFSAEEAGIVDDITKEVLTGPSDLNPEKILGPGGVAISTSKDILMSFGATVRFIPTFESNWDFGLSEEVPGYVYTDVIKNYARSALDTGKAVEDVLTASKALNDAIENQRGGIFAAYDDFNTALYAANQSALSPAIGPTLSSLADSMSMVDENMMNAVDGIAIPVASPVADAVAAAAAQAAVQPGASLETIQQAAYTAGSQTAQGLAAAISDPQQQAIASVSGEAAAMSAAAAAATTAGMVAEQAFQQALAAGADMATAAAAAQSAAAEAAVTPANNAAVNAASGTAAATVLQAAFSTPNPALGNATLLQVTDQVAAGFAQAVTKNPAATSAQLTDANAYLTGLKATVDAFQPYYLADSFLKTHSNEGGSYNDGYIRTEAKLYFNAMPRDKKWSFYAALEYDKGIDTDTVDNRGGKDAESSNFGLERLNASIALGDNLRFHGGWDIWGLDIIEAGSLVYGDDNAGFWLNGDYGDNSFSLGWFKLEENDFQNGPTDHFSSNDNDRDVVATYLNRDISENSKVRVFYAWDRIRNATSLDLVGALASQAGLADYAGIYGNNGIPGGAASDPDTDSHHIGAYYLGKFGIIELMAEGVYKFGQASDTGLKGVNNGAFTIQYDDFDISSYAFAGDIGFELGERMGWMSFKPHIGFIYTSGDDDPTDDELGGYSGVANAQRFAAAFGGENTIIADTNMVYGSALYGYIPEFHGNGTPVFVGGLQNFVGNGNGRGDNPGLSLLSMGVTMRPKIFLIYRTNVNMFHWNEDFMVANMVQPITLDMTTGSMTKTPYTPVEAGFVGTEWDQELTLALSKNMFIKTQLAFFFPGEVIEDVTAAISGGTSTDEMASRFAFEFIWNF